MIVSDKIGRLIADQEGWTRKMFEAAIQMRKEYGPENVYDFSLGNPDIEPPSELRKKLIDALRNPAPGMHRYMPNNGYEEVREEIAAYLRERTGLPFTSRHVFMTVGCAGAINILFKTILNEGDEVILPNPFFWEFKNYVENFGGVLKFVETREDFQLDVEAIEQAITPKTKGSPDQQPQQPDRRCLQRGKPQSSGSGALQTRERKARRYISSPTRPTGSLFTPRSRFPTFSGYMTSSCPRPPTPRTLPCPGERIGYLAISPHIAEAETLVSGLMIAIRALGFVNAPAFFQRVVGEFQRNSVSIADYREKRDLLYDTLIEAGFRVRKARRRFLYVP